KLFESKFLSPAQWVSACRGLDAARAEVALHKADQARLAWKLAALTGQVAVDPAALLRLRIAAARAAVRCGEAPTAGIQYRLEKAEKLVRNHGISDLEFNQCKRAYDNACEALAVDRRRRDTLESQGEHDRGFVQELEELAFFLRLRWDYERAKRLYQHTL